MTIPGWRDAPPWLVSLLIHLGLLLVLALIPLVQSLPAVISLQAGFATAGEQVLDDSLVTTAVEMPEVAVPALALTGPPTEDPLAALANPQLLLEGPGSQPVNLEAPAIGLALTGREAGSKKALLAIYGGGEGTEAAVARALEWLKRNQQRDGSWSLQGPYADGVTVENRTAATALALLAFQGNGHTHQSGQYQPVVAKGLTALLKMQDRDGNFFRAGISGHRLYSQALATIVVCELYGMTKDSDIRPAAERALEYAARIQADDGQGGGGWRYQPGQDVDTSVTGWFVMAFQSARMAGLEIPSQTLHRVSLFLDHVERVDTDPNGSIRQIDYFYRIGEEPKLSMTAEALLCRQYLGWPAHEPRLRAGVRRLLANPIRWEEPSIYYWYYATQVLHHVGGADWHAWNSILREALPEAQVPRGREAGSWSPAGDPYGYQGGRMYSTCLCVLMLESYYRHLPVYQHTP